MKWVLFISPGCFRDKAGVLQAVRRGGLYALPNGLREAKPVRLPEGRSTASGSDKSYIHRRPPFFFVFLIFRAFVVKWFCPAWGPGKL
jgi:hypothetical protein